MKGKLKLLLLLLLFVVTPVFAASDDLLIANDSVTVEEDKAGSAFMAGNDVTVVVVKTCKLSSYLGNISVAGSVESVTADLVLLIILVRNTVCLSVIRNGLKE